MNIYDMSGSIYLSINTDKDEYSYNDLEHLFKKYIITDKYYKILNKDDIVYTNLYKLPYDDKIKISDIKIVFVNYDANMIFGIKLYGIKYYDDEVKNNEDLVIVATEIYSNSIKYASNELKNNRNFIIKILKINAKSLIYIPKKYKNDEELMSICIKKDVDNYIFVSDELKKNRK
jgi:hypothetical protein